MIRLDDFLEFLSIPSVSSEPAFTKEVRKAAEWVQKRLMNLGFKVELWEKAGFHPIVFASTAIDPKKPTLLIYNHYDVQPVDPLELWESPPFEPKIKDGQVYARGAQDNKGQLFYVLEALRLLKEREGSFPINIKLCIEGEEECGSAHLQQILKQKTQELKADYAAIVDLGIPSADTPAVTLGTRGLVTFDIEVEGSKVDLHSGSHGGIAFNPIHALVQLLASVRDENGAIAIPGFYDDVEELSAKNLEKISFHFDEKQYEKDFGLAPTGGDRNYEPLERLWLRPTFEVNGIWGGYIGEGFKTVIPAKAHAKFSCRLVPRQTPENIGEKVKEYLEKKAPPGITVKVKAHGGGGAARVKPDSQGVLAFAQAYCEVFGKPCQFILEGASIPIIPELASASGADPVLIGLGLQTDLIHAPNEHFGIDRLEKGAKIVMRAIELLAK
jgi:acetylornithine deacetylase/succinyl-diaminopimelate desuccinylase-like protein